MTERGHYRHRYDPKIHGPGNRLEAGPEWLTAEESRAGQHSSNTGPRLVSLTECQHKPILDPVRQILSELGVSQAKLCRALGVDQGAMSNKLSGRRRWYLDELQRAYIYLREFDDSLELDDLLPAVAVEDRKALKRAARTDGANTGPQSDAKSARG